MNKTTLQKVKEYFNEKIKWNEELINKLSGEN